MLRPLFVLPALLLFQQPASAPAPDQSPIPAEAAHLANPIKPTSESQAHARKMYGYDCAVCHGATGNGKGDLTDLKPAPRDFTDPAALKDLSDGELFYIIKNGRGQMPPEGDRMKPDDLWNMVVLLRSFAKK
ncbi:cytochrome c [Granulicella sp. dw_53]|uniref:c-type cytochrome n=1 Tax=Granulicella sp. dw_53 TaxID=2719792 RepID=UPI001BD25B6D|nr:cytochrome c [Granulicella sp. dw_53]